MSWSKVTNIKGLQGSPGINGIDGKDSTVPGPVGSSGNPGQAASISVGSVTTLAAGASATVANSGTSMAAVLNFGLPRGAAGADGVSPVRYAKRLATTDATGILNVTLPTGLFTNPIVSADVECPAADQTNYSYRCEMIGPVTSNVVKIRVTRQSLTLVVSILGAVITAINTAPAGTYVNILVIEST